MCENCGVFIKNKRIRQRDTGICWAAAIFHILQFSDGLSECKEFRCKNPELNLNKAIKIVGECSQSLCVDDDYVKMPQILDPIVVVQDEVPLLYEHNRPRCSIASANSGGKPWNDIFPYIIKLCGYPLDAVRHVIVDFNNIRKFNRNPRTLKYTRILRDYIMHILEKPEKPEKPDLKICIITFFQGEHKGKFNVNNTLYLGKYVMFVKNVRGHDALYVYKLDSMVLNSFNNGESTRPNGHAMCAITCGNEPYIVNTYDAADANDLGDCGLYEYNWTKWVKKEIFAYQINDGGLTCQPGPSPDEGILRDINDNYDMSGFYTQKNVFMYHRNIGNNSFIYVKTEHIDIDIDASIIKKHYVDLLKSLQPSLLFDIYILYIAPYFIYFTLQTKEQKRHIQLYKTSLTDEEIKTLKTYTVEADGIMVDFNRYIVFFAHITNEQLQLMLEIMPDDFRIYSTPRAARDVDGDAEMTDGSEPILTVYICVELLADGKAKHYGGKKTTRAPTKPKSPLPPKPLPKKRSTKV